MSPYYLIRQLRHSFIALLPHHWLHMLELLNYIKKWDVLSFVWKKKQVSIAMFDGRKFIAIDLTVEISEKSRIAQLLTYPVKPISIMEEEGSWVMIIKIVKISIFSDFHFLKTKLHFNGHVWLMLCSYMKWLKLFRQLKIRESISRRVRSFSVFLLVEFFLNLRLLLSAFFRWLWIMKFRDISWWFFFVFSRLH